MDVPEFVILLVALSTAGWLLSRSTRFKARVRGWAADAADSVETPDGVAVADAQAEVGPTNGLGADRAAKLYSASAELNSLAENSAHPRDFLASPVFERAVELLEDSDLAPEDLVGYALGANVVVSCIALEALARRQDGRTVVGGVLEGLGSLYAWPLFFAIRFVKAHSGPPVFPRIVTRSQAWWGSMVSTRELLVSLIESDVAAGYQPQLPEDVLARDPEVVEGLKTLFEALGEPAVGYQLALEDWVASHTDASGLEAIGRFWKDAPKGVIESDGFRRTLDQLEKEFRSEPKRSMILVGEHGVGKTTLARQLASRLAADGWTFFEAGANEVLSGQIYVGMLEERLKLIVEKASVARRVVWFMPDMHESLYAGSHSLNPQGVLHKIIPGIDRGEVLIIGETTSDGYARMVEAVPSVRRLFNRFPVDPLDDAESFALAASWASERLGAEIADDLLVEAQDLARVYLVGQAAPGNLIGILRQTAERLESQAGTATAMSVADLMDTVSQITGLPSAILDDRLPLDLDELRSRFEARVVGQSEAVDVLVQRVSMIKAGVCDPSRPYGVFLFVGPTGTGKTEIAKAITSFLFGGEDRMIRIDMSELQRSDGEDRLLGAAGAPGRAHALVDQIRKQPFSVVLLDEFEKAHPRIWDLFLQVFDDGRLTDRRGNVADFRHSLIIMTSNLGATVPKGVSIGFGGTERQFSPAAVGRMVGQSFRKEFLNRIDRVVVFRPLSRASLKKILTLELSSVLERRGLRRRTWAVEWEESAIEFLLDHGTSIEFGARPLKRAVERFLLAPLADTIVRRAYPEGDQFLFVKRDGDGLAVEFVDPDAPLDGSAGGIVSRDGSPGPPSAVSEQTLSVRAITLAANGSPEEYRFLDASRDELAARLDGKPWVQRKEALYAALGEDGFWDTHSRFEVLAELEYMDRIETGFETTDSLLDRLAGTDTVPRASYRPDLIKRLAEQLYLVGAAYDSWEEGQPRDAILCIVARPDGNLQEANRFAERIGSMYRGWAERRRMRLEVLAEASVENEPYRLVLAVSGFGAYRILSSEAGLHVFEVLDDRRNDARLRVRVQVVGQPVPYPDRAADKLAAAEASLSQSEGDQRVVRRYRELPSPLVRDAVAGWRTGRSEAVFAGDFDVMG